MNAVIYALFVVLPYVSLAVLIGGSTYRVLRWAATPKGSGGLYLGLYRLVNRAGQRGYLSAAGHILARMLTFYTIPKNSYGRDYGTWLGVFLFHWGGVFLLIAFHLHLWMPWLRVGEETMYVTGMATGGAVALGAGLFLLARRVGGLERIYGLALNALDDYVAITWVVIIIGLGLAMRALAPPPACSGRRWRGPPGYPASTPPPPHPPRVPPPLLRPRLGRGALHDLPPPLLQDGASIHVPPREPSAVRQVRGHG